MPVEVIAACGVALYIVAMALAFLPTKCPHPCAECKAEHDRRVAKNLVERHDFEHMWFKTPTEDCETCKKMRNK